MMKRLKRWTVKIRYLDGHEEERPSFSRPKIRKGVLRVRLIDGFVVGFPLQSVRHFWVARVGDLQSEE